MLSISECLLFKNRSIIKLVTGIFFINTFKNIIFINTYAK